MTQRGPGVLVAPNITPDPETGIGSWTGDEIAQAIREGVSRDGRALFTLMPYYSYQRLTGEDLDAIFAYLRTVKPIKHWVNTKATPVLCAVCNMAHGMGEMN